jgi:hypothetical protein
MTLKIAIRKVAAYALIRNTASPVFLIDPEAVLIY